VLWDKGNECRFDGSRVSDCSSQSAEAKHWLSSPLIICDSPTTQCQRPWRLRPFHQQLHSSLLSSGWRLGGTAWEGALATSVTSRTWDISNLPRQLLAPDPPLYQTGRAESRANLLLSTALLSVCPLRLG
jgi:hypothetical protein